MSCSDNQNAPLLCTAQQVDDSDLAQYSPATVLELKQWAQAVSSGGFISRKQHAATVVAAVQFIVEHEPDPGTYSGADCIDAHGKFA